MQQTIITELSGKVLVIQSEIIHIVTEEGLKAIAAEFEQHGFKVIWLSL